MNNTYEVKVECKNCHYKGTLMVTKGKDFTPANILQDARIGNPFFGSVEKPKCPTCGSGKLYNTQKENQSIWK